MLSHTKNKSIKDVTLVAYTSIEFDATIRSLLISSEKLDFGAIKLISHEKPNNLPEKIHWEYGPKINDINDFNYYMFRELGNHVTTSHALYVQHHAYVLHPELFENSWLEYDYNAAPWRIVPNSYIANNGERVRVGNGGFSLRSKYLMDLPFKENLKLRSEQNWFNEDGNICCYYRKEFLELGIKYAPIEVAVNFAFENVVFENYGRRSFGFHRNMNPWN